MRLNSNRYWLSALMISACLWLVTGCTKETPVELSTADQADQTDYDKKMSILDQVEPPMTTLGLMTNLLASEWPLLFTAKDESELFQRYAQLTWNPTSNNQEMLRNHLEKHPEYASYVDLYKKGVLPAKQVTVQNLQAELVDAKLKSYEVEVTYDLLLHNGTHQEVSVRLPVNRGLDVMNQRFNTDGDVAQGPLPEPANEQAQKRQDFMLRILKTLSWKMNKDQLNELIR